MSPQIIELDGREIAYALKRSRRRTIGFAISHDGLQVTAPMRVSEREIERALRSKSGWILKKLDVWAERPKPVELEFVSDETLPWLGGGKRLVIEQRGVRTRVTAEEEIIRVSIDPELEGALRARAIRSGLVRHYKREGERLMAPKVDAFAAQLGCVVRKVIVREQKSRWGSCAPDGSIRLNWRLMGFPEELIDYVCAHEAAHLVEANHSPAYWAVVERLMPDWKLRRSRMRDEAARWVAF